MNPITQFLAWSLPGRLYGSTVKDAVVIIYINPYNFNLTITRNLFYSLAVTTNYNNDFTIRRELNYE